MITPALPRKEEQFPVIPKDLLEKLNELFPERCAELGDDEKTIRHKSGQRHVVRFLNEQFKHQNETVLRKT